MIFAADFHIHSRYSRATSPRMDLENLEKWAKIKGITVLGSGDFTHPLWFKELKDKLEPAESGLFKLKSSIAGNGGSKNYFGSGEVRFILTGEISCIYSKNNKVRKVHLVIFAPSFETVEKINVYLGWIGNLKADGRPILGLDAKEAVKTVLNCSPDCLVVPAHVWTPWFSVFGSKSGFDSIEECFEEYSPEIKAIETGLSSSPDMNWRLSALDKITLISNSDSHSPEKIGREANVFDCGLNYQEIIKTIKEKDRSKFLYTIEFFPEEGKYHYDGHRLCNISLGPEESKKGNYICPVCKKQLTIGVLSRVNELADRPIGFKPENAIPFKSLVSLEEIIAEALGQTTVSKQVSLEYDNLIRNFNSELDVLINVSLSDIAAVAKPEIIEGISCVREGKVKVEPGYDGVYGKVNVSTDKKAAAGKVLTQKQLF